MRKALIVLGSLLIIVVSLLVFKKNDKVIKSVAFKHNYVELLTDENETLNIYLCFSKKNSFFTFKDNVSRLVLKEEDDSKSFSIPLKNIYKSSSEIIFEANKYYEYIFELDVLKISESLNLENTILEITYINNEKLTLKIGEVYYKKVNLKNDDLDLFSVKSIVNEINNHKSIVGFSLTFNIKEPLRITNISFLTNNLNSDLNLAIKDLKTVNNLNLRDIYGDDYKYLDLPNRSYIELMDNTNYFIPIKYNNFNKYNKVPIIIEYEINGVKKTYYFDDAIYFSDNELIIEDRYEYHYQ